VRRAVVVFTLMASAVCLLSTAREPGPRIVWNATASSPIGLYAVQRTTKLSVGDLVIVIPPLRVASFLADRGFLPRGVPLIKRILALSGQTVCRYGLMITVDNLNVGVARKYDSLGRPLPNWEGCQTMANTDVFFMNRNQSASLDGRYFGAFPRSSIIGSAIPLWTVSE
jgi:conjugative transfer signal peptidase TraF